MPDLGSEMTDSLSRTGKGGMLTPLRGVNGSASVPAHSFTDFVQSGTYMAGAGDLRIAVTGVNKLRLLDGDTRPQYWSVSGGAWLNVADSADVIALQGEIATNAAAIVVNADDIASISAPAASAVVYDNNVSGLSATQVQAAIDEIDEIVVAKAALAGADFTGQASSTSGDFNLVTNTALADTAATLTAAQLIGGEFTIAPTVARIQTLDTAANIISALSGSVDNSNFTFTIINLAAFDVTITTAAGVTLVGNMVVNDGCATFRVRRLNSSTISVTRIESGSGSSSATSQIMIAMDQKASGTNGGTFNSGDWRTRDLNTITTNTISGAFINTSNNRINLPAGRYLITASAPAHEVGRHQLKLLNITDSLDAIIGSSEFSGNSSNCTTRSFIADVLNITAGKDFFLQHRCDNTASNDGFGKSCDFSVAESYAEIKIEKIG
tara:strand:+ start:13973 stop:15289 length:1317 start_codon:yes stop_codon:yes gene_type:complete